MVATMRMWERLNPMLSCSSLRSTVLANLRGPGATFVTSPVDAVEKLGLLSFKFRAHAPEVAECQCALQPRVAST
jgi:hypothetical protein